MSSKKSAVSHSWTSKHRFFMGKYIFMVSSIFNSETLSITTQERLLPYWQLFLYGWQVSMTLNMNKILPLHWLKSF
jgi:hypothetical protein